MPKLARKRTSTSSRYAPATKKVKFTKRKTIDYTTGRKTASVVKAQEFTTWLHGAWQMPIQLVGTASTATNPNADVQGYGSWGSASVATNLSKFNMGVNLSNVFERYKVHRMRVTIHNPGQGMYIMSKTTGGSQTNPQIPDLSYTQGAASRMQNTLMCASYVDIDDVQINSPNPSQVLQHADAWPMNFDKPIKRSFVPGVTLPLDTPSGVITTSALAGTKLSNQVWINTNAGTSVQLSGMKYAVWVPSNETCNVLVLSCTIDLKVTFQGLNYTSQPDKIAKLLASVAGQPTSRPEAKDDVDANQESMTTDESDQEEAMHVPRTCRVHKRKHTDGHVCH